MPSGAKKRKAAKKQKQKVASTSSNLPPTSTAHSLGEEDLKHRESAGEEAEVVEKREGISSVEQSESTGDGKNGSEGVEKRVDEDEGVVQIEQDPKPDDEYDNKNGGSSSDGSSNSSSSSDDESPAVEKDIEVMDSGPVVYIVEKSDSLSEGPIHTTPVITIDSSVEEAANEFDAGKASLLDQKVPADLSGSANDSLISDAIESGVKENGEKTSSSLEDSAILLEVVKDLAPEHKIDEATNAEATPDAKESEACVSQDKLVLSYLATEQANSDIKESEARASENKVVLSDYSPKDDAIEHCENAKDSEVHGSLDLRPLISLTPQPVQITSWKSCCGLLEALTGSNR